MLCKMTSVQKNVTTDVKVEMSCISIIQKAFETIPNDTSCLKDKIGSVCVKELDIIIRNVRKSWAPCKAIVVSIIAKLMYPDWDTRNHQTQIGGKHSLRTIDRRYVGDYMFKNGFYDTATEFALTRSFEKAEPFTKTYSGKISPTECKSAFLNLVEIINTTATTELLDSMLLYLMIFLIERKADNTALKSSTLESSRELTLADVSTQLEAIHNLGSGSSVVPVIVVHTLLSVVSAYLFPGVSIKDLKQHTASDNHTHSYGDVEGFRDSNPILSVEVKHKIVINDSIVSIFDKKTSERNMLKFILTTANTPKRHVRNICIDTVSGFTTYYLQHAMMYEVNICSIFIKELRTRIVSYDNISVEMKKSINKILTELLELPSP